MRERAAYSLKHPNCYFGCFLTSEMVVCCHPFLLPFSFRAVVFSFLYTPVAGGFECPATASICAQMLTPLSAIAPAGATRTAGPSHRTNAPTIVLPSPLLAMSPPLYLQPPGPTNTLLDTLPLAFSHGSSPGIFDAPKFPHLLT